MATNTPTNNHTAADKKNLREALPGSVGKKKFKVPDISPH
jgi:hypothetical protein